MGTVLGKIAVEQPKYEVTSKGEGYEVREYPSQLAAEVTYDPATMKGNADGGFMILAGYIGAVGKPKNIKAEGDSGEKIAMTAPVITQETQKGESEKLAMTEAPVITQKSEGGKKLVTMQFILPAQYNTVEITPKPTDERVVIKEVPARKYGVTTFSGIANNSLVEKELTGLRISLEKAGFKITGQHILARYNPPWTPWFLRTNEVLLPVE